MQFLKTLPSVERNLLAFGVGGYSIGAVLYSAMTPSSKSEPAKHEASSSDTSPQGTSAAAKAAQNGKTTASSGEAAADPLLGSDLKLEGPNDPMVLFALQDIQSRLSIIEKALKLSK